MVNNSSGQTVKDAVSQSQIAYIDELFRGDVNPIILIQVKEILDKRNDSSSTTKIEDDKT